MMLFRWKMRLADLVDNWDRVWAAEIRWRAHNRETRRQGCPCGRPGTVVQYHDGFVGSVPPESWTCNKHAGADSWRQVNDGEPVPMYGRPRPCLNCAGNCSTSGRIGEPTPHTWYCSLRPEEA